MYTQTPWLIQTLLIQVKNSDLEIHVTNVRE
jgi:hypothetical protein